MTISTETALVGGLGAIPRAPTISRHPGLTTQAQVTLADPGFNSGSLIKVKISNLSTTNTVRVAYTFVPVTSANPTVTADLSNVNCGTILAAGQVEYFTMSASNKMFVVATAAADVLVVSYII